MTFKEFEDNFFNKILPNKPSYIRNGQALFNYLARTWPEEADRLVATKLDCFHTSAIMDALLTHLKKEWERYPY